ncbi:MULTISPECIES: hypothetical protein [Streptococcus]|nr:MULTISPECIES: hypothetical protein [Streptococcus]CIN63321.1 chlorohydrolase [Streptococcus pseudopneumoniae]CIO88013.1 chlorohydrolase [Streptococcus pseudopneumoniae]
MNLYSMKIKEQTRKLAAGCSKHSFEVVDKTDEVSDHIYGKATLTWFEEIFEEYYFLNFSVLSYIGDKEISLESAYK